MKSMNPKRRFVLRILEQDNERVILAVQFDTKFEQLEAGQVGKMRRTTQGYRRFSESF